MASEGILKLSYKQLEEYTNCFHEEKYLGNFQFGKLYRGMIGEKEVTVKIWQDDVIYRVYPGDNEKRLQNELELLKLPEMKSNLNVVKLIGYCLEGEQLGVVYDLKLLDTLHNLLLKDEFTWVPRIKVALGLAGLLRFLHFQNSPDLPYWVCNISAAHILLDQDGNPKLCDFGMIIGGLFQERTNNFDLLAGCYGYVDPSYLRRDLVRWGACSFFGGDGQPEFWRRAD